MEEKVKKTLTYFHYHSLVNLRVLYLSCHLLQRRAQALPFLFYHTICDLFHGFGAKSDTELPAFSCQNNGKYMFEHSYCYIIIYL